MIGELEASCAAYSPLAMFILLCSASQITGQSEWPQPSASSKTGCQPVRLNTGRGNRWKRHPFRFSALWKGVKPESPVFPPPGPGRPGWHIECSAMLRQELGTTIRHSPGGSDLIFIPTMRMK